VEGWRKFKEFLTGWFQDDSKKNTQNNRNLLIHSEVLENKPFVPFVLKKIKQKNQCHQQNIF
jgi:hypothetical protein